MKEDKFKEQTLGHKYLKFLDESVVGQKLQEAFEIGGIEAFNKYRKVRSSDKQNDFLDTLLGSELVEEIEKVNNPDISEYGNLNHIPVHNLYLTWGRNKKHS